MILVISHGIFNYEIMKYIIYSENMRYADPGYKYEIKNYEIPQSNHKIEQFNPSLDRFRSCFISVDGLNTKFDYGKNNIRRSVIYMVWIFIKVNDLHKSDS